MIVKCLSMQSWSDVVIGDSEALLISRRVPYGMRFRVYVGKWPMPRFVDGRHRFVCLGCARYGLRKYVCKVRVETPFSV